MSEPRAASAFPAARAAMLPLMVAVVVLVPRLCVRTWRCARDIPAQLAAARAFLTLPPDVLIERASGLSPKLLGTVQQHVPPVTRVIVYSSLGGELGAELLGNTFERLKNLVWPRPCDVRYAQRRDDPVARFLPEDVDRVLVVDMAAGAPPRPELPGRYELLYQDQLLRVWLLREVVQ